MLQLVPGDSLWPSLPGLGPWTREGASPVCTSRQFVRDLLLVQGKPYVILPVMPMDRPYRVPAPRRLSIDSRCRTVRPRKARPAQGHGDSVKYDENRDLLR